MDKRVDNKGGAREGAGRKTGRDERLMNLVIGKCWEELEKYLDETDKSRTLSEQEKKHIILEIAKKTIPKVIEGKGDEGQIVIQINKTIAEKNGIK